MSGPEAKWTFAQKFYVDFSGTASDLNSRIDALKIDIDVPPAAIRTIASDLSRLTKNLGDATGSLPSYDQRQCELQLKALEKRIEELRATSTSAPKFLFKRKAAKSKPPAEPPSVVVPPPTQPQSNPTESANILAGFSRRYLSIFDVCSPDTSVDVSICDLEDCIVNFLPDDDDQKEITALHVQRVSRSIVLLPRISGSIILHDLSECVLAVGCHQFRMHNSTSTDVYLESVSDPIIEHSSGIRFAEYPTSLVRGMSLQNSKHFAVKDFSHILSTPSPNWSLLPEETREKSWPVSILEDQDLRAELERILSAHSRPSAGP